MQAARRSSDAQWHVSFVGGRMRVYGLFHCVGRVCWRAVQPGLTIVAGAQFCISREDFVLIFGGLSIRQQLSMLTSMKGLPLIYHAEIAKKAHQSETRHSGSTPTTTSSPRMLQQEHCGQNSHQRPSNEWLPGSVRSVSPLQMQVMGMILSL